MTNLPLLPTAAAITGAARRIMTALAMLALVGCRSLPPQPPIDISGPVWVVREGQAVWQPRAGADGIAGDLLVATHPDGRSVVQFTKTPLPFLVAQRTAQGWQVQFIPRNKTYSGRGEPPARLLWLHLPTALKQGSAPDGFRFTTNTTGGWRFERRATGESLEGYFEPRSKTTSRSARVWSAAFTPLQYRMTQGVRAVKRRKRRAPQVESWREGKRVVPTVWASKSELLPPAPAP